MSRSIKLDLVTAFAASGTKALAYMAISSMLLEGGAHVADFAMFTVIRSTLGLLNYATLGLAPAFIRQLAGMLAVPTAALEAAPKRPGRLDYATEATDQAMLTTDPHRLYASAQYPALGIGLLALACVCMYALLFRHIHNVPEEVWTRAPWAAFMVGLAMLARLVSDVPGGYLQATHRITLDNLLVLSADVLWVALTWSLLRAGSTPLIGVSLSFCICYALLSLSRFTAAAIVGAPIFAPISQVDRPMARHLLGFGVLLTLSQLSDFLYAPTDFLLINWYLTKQHVANYSIAVQVDAGLLLLTAAVATVLYPRASRAVALRDEITLRKYYLRGTALTATLLTAAALALIAIAPHLLQIWLGTDAPGARAILPLVLLHSIVGGSSAPSRAILLAAGRARVFAISAVVAGVLNVIISYVLVRYTTLGLTGVVIGTLIAVILRCAFFLPWYTLRVLGEMRQSKQS
jgi:O-antigen/teichoic acid export membrane protein